MNKNRRVETANQTLKIIEIGQYQIANQNVNVKDGIQYCIDYSKTIQLDDWESVFVEVENKKAHLNNRTIVKVLNCSTIEALAQTTDGLKSGILNFASAKNPGGGFLGGASAQEESLARSSCLYASQTKDMTMYQYNRNQSTFLYSDLMIYSPQVVFWFDDLGNPLTNPVKTDIITSPAPNKGAMLQHNRKDEIEKIETVFK
jgi:uncharacterized protein (TIGR02452 family)